MTLAMSTLGAGLRPARPPRGMGKPGTARRFLMWRAALALAGMAAGGACLAGDETPAPVPAAAAPASADPAPLPEPVPAPPPAARWEGAIGPVLSYSPEYTGGGRRKLGGDLGFFLRYGRWTVSNTGAFVTRRADDISPGLGSDVHLSDTVRSNLSLRVDRGRSSSSSEALRGIDSVRPTVRARLGTTWTPGPDHPLGGWRTGLALTTDLLGRGGGQTLDWGVSREHRWGDGLRWSYGANLAAASSAYMDRYFGVSAAEASRTTYAEFHPGAGLRDFSVSTGWRMEVNPLWVAFWGGSVGRLLGPAARSPLTAQPRHWSLDGGVARRF